MTSVIKVDKFWDRAEVAADTEYTYLFGDNTNDRLNTKHIPYKTQAVIRGLPNAIGIDTRYSQEADFADTDDNFARFQQHVDEQIQKALDIGKPIKVSAGGFATGAGVGLPQRFKDYLNNAINMIGSVPPKPTELKLTKIISGMQKNVDQYGIEAAKVLGLDYGGTVNKGFKVVPEGNNSPNFQEFVDSGKWEEIESQYYPDRTKANAQNADGTVWFGKGDSLGYGATKKASGDKPWIENPETPQELRNWMIENNIETLNVAGNRSYGTEELGQAAKQLIIDAVNSPKSLGAAALNDEKVFTDKINDIKIDDSIVQDVVKNAPGWLIVPVEQAVETVLRRVGIEKAAALAAKLVKYELYTFGTALASGGIAAGTSALTVPQTAQAMLLTGNYDEFNKRVDTLEEDMMENAKINGGMMMGMIVRAMPSYWLDEWFLKRNPEFKDTWKETFPQLGATPVLNKVGDVIARGWNNMFGDDE